MKQHVGSPDLGENTIVNILVPLGPGFPGMPGIPFGPGLPAGPFGP